MRLFAERGFEATTLRDIAEAAGTSASLLYRYFPGKHALVLACYDELSAEYARRAEAMPAGTWRDRFLFALRTSLDVLGPQRSTLRALVPVLVADEAGGVFAPQTSFSRERVAAVFRAAVTGASDRPRGAVAGALGNLLYVVHLAVILWWVIDRSPGGRATFALLELLGRGKSLAALAVRLPFAHGFIIAAEAIARDALFGDSEAEP